MKRAFDPECFVVCPKSEKKRRRQRERAKELNCSFARFHFAEDFPIVKPIGGRTAAS
jgi:hypothetical protein